MTSTNNQQGDPGALVDSGDWTPARVAQLSQEWKVLEQLWVDLDATVQAGPAAGSLAASEVSDQLGAFANDLALTFLRTTLDHLVSWRMLLMEAHFQPTFAHYSLLRTAHESALYAYWLVEPSITPTQRLARGVAAQTADYNERRKVEDALGMKQATPPAKTAAGRLDDLMQEASRRGLTRLNKNGDLILVTPLPNIVDVYDAFESRTSADGSQTPGSYLYRLLSGYAHGKQWAAMQGVQATRPLDKDGRTLGTATTDPDRAIAMTQRVVAAMKRAVDAVVTYRS